MKERDIIDDMIDEFGYDYTIGYCLCSEYKHRTKAERIESDARRKKEYRQANYYKRRANQLNGERIDNGL